MNPYAVRSCLGSSGIRPNKKLGQNFLADANVARKLIRLLEPRQGEIFLEIGAGTGALTVPLAEEGVRVFAVEVDRRLVRILKSALEGFENVDVIDKDILEVSVPALLKKARASRIHVIGNLPYSITTQIVLYLVGYRRHVGRVVVTVQREYAARMLARPGTRQYGSLSVLLQFYAKVELLASISPRSFFPAPEVSSAVLRLEFRPTPAVSVKNETCFEAVVRAAFSHRRKMLINSLAEQCDLEKANALRLLKLASVDGTRRAEQLRLEELARIADVFYDEKVFPHKGDCFRK
jgi:16S rRNA (adenine1518-N6/adenine1519-N6)-dimethyltransferase